MAISILLRSVLGFVSPIAIYNLLRYVETGGEGAAIKPW